MQPETAKIRIPIVGGAVELSAADIDRLGKVLILFSLIDAVDQEKNGLIAYLAKTKNEKRARVIGIEVQHTLLDSKGRVVTDIDSPFRYSVGHAFAIGSKYLITAAHVVMPQDPWLEEETEDWIWVPTLILAQDPNFALPSDKLPHETDRWSGNSEYTIQYKDLYKDICLLKCQAQYTHHRLPLANEPLGHGKRVFSVNVRNSASIRVFEGSCWLSEMSEGEYYDTTSYCDFGFSGGPVIGTWQRMILGHDLILVDSHGALVGLLLSDAEEPLVDF